MAFGMLRIPSSVFLGPRHESGPRHPAPRSTPSGPGLATRIRLLQARRRSQADPPAVVEHSLFEREPLGLPRDHARDSDLAA
jgi:hypothetical protein